MCDINQALSLHKRSQVVEALSKNNSYGFNFENAQLYISKIHC